MVTRRSQAPGLSVPADPIPPTMGLQHRLLGDVLGGGTVARDGVGKRDRLAVLGAEEVIETDLRITRRRSACCRERS